MTEKEILEIAAAEVFCNCYQKDTGALAEFLGLNLRIPGELTRILEKKSTKTYKTEKVWLVIRNGFPLWDKEDFENYKSEIILPKKHPFEKIWLICDSRGYSGLAEIGV